MEAVIFIGLQAAGKSSFYRQRFFTTHVRISLDQLRTRHRERRMLNVCLETQQPFVVDNTNPTLAERSNYIELAKRSKYKVVGYYFCSILADCLARNAARREPVADVGLLATAKKLQRPSFMEGFDELVYVRLTESGLMEEEWQDEI